MFLNIKKIDIVLKNKTVRNPWICSCPLHHVNKNASVRKIDTSCRHTSNPTYFREWPRDQAPYCVLVGFPVGHVSSCRLECRRCSSVRQCPPFHMPSPVSRYLCGINLTDFKPSLATSRVLCPPALAPFSHLFLFNSCPLVLVSHSIDIPSHRTMTSFIARSFFCCVLQSR